MIGFSNIIDEKGFLTFGQKYDIIKHEVKEHINKLKIICKICNKSISDDHMGRHMKVHKNKPIDKHKDKHIGKPKDKTIIKDIYILTYYKFNNNDRSYTYPDKKGMYKIIINNINTFIKEKNQILRDYFNYCSIIKYYNLTIKNNIINKTKKNKIFQFDKYNINNIICLKCNINFKFKNWENHKISKRHLSNIGIKKNNIENKIKEIKQQKNIKKIEKEKRLILRIDNFLKKHNNI